MHLIFKAILLVAFAIISTPTFGQKPASTKFGKVDTKWVELQEYAPDPNVDAVVLMDIGSTAQKYNQELYIRQERHYRIKIFKESALDLGDIEIPFFSYRSTDRVAELHAETHYMENGKVISQKYDKNAAFEENVDGYYSKIKLSMPNVKPGAVIEVKYVINSKNFTHMDPWYFQRSIPTLYSEFTQERIKGFNYRVLALGEAVQLDKKERSEIISYTVKNARSTDPSGIQVKTATYDRQNLEVFIETYTASNIPALQTEAFSPEPLNYYSRLELQLQSINLPGFYSGNYIKSWEQLSEDLLKEEGAFARINPNKSISQEAQKITKDLATEAEKAGAIFQYVKQNTQWSEVYGRYPDVNTNKLLKEGKGNSASINLFMLGLLRGAGLDAHPILVSTRKNGQTQSSFPTLRQFNHTMILVLIGDGVQLLDAVNSSSNPSLLPVNVLNGKGFLVHPSAPQFLDIKPEKGMVEQYVSILNLQADGSLQGKIISSLDGYSGSYARRGLGLADNEDEYVQNLLLKGLTDVELSSKKLMNQHDLSKAMTAEIELEIGDYAGTHSGENMYIEPLMHMAREENPFEAAERKYPIDFVTPIQQKHIFTYIIPEGYTIESVPSPASMSIPGGGASFVFQAQQMGNSVQVLSDFKITKAVFMPDEYEMLRGFYEEVVQKHGERIVVKKVSE